MAPLTGFFGANSSGKTAILQFLLMLKQTVESSDRNRILHLGGDQYSYVDLGTTYDISHRHQLPQKFQFQFEWIPKYIDVSGLSVPYMVKTSPLIPAYKQNADNSLKFESVITIEADQINFDFFRYTFTVDKYIGESYGWNYLTIMNSFDKENNSQNYTLSKDGRFFEEFHDLQSLEGKSFPRIKQIENPQLIKNYGILHNVDISEYQAAYEDLFQNTYYLAPLREYPRRTYQWSGESPQGVGKYGEFTVAALLASRKKEFEVELSVARDLQKLTLIHNFRVNRITPNRGDYEILVQKSLNSAEVLITDVGFGVSQVLPILVLCYYAPKGATLIFEQPEIHLHPSVQAGLADIFIEVIKTRNIQIIIESHSEHLLTRLQRRMAEEKDGFTNEDAALYFCKMNDQGDSELITLDVDDYGNICNYPDGFFGDSMGDAVAMTEAAIKRQMNAGD
ncbi:AAA family ATPase [Pseudanabaena minima]|uniref:AAA family ATPase n=1 Tax=Pseudanabaena minima TaxID=890415 RepID=UPI003DA9DC94